MVKPSDHARTPTPSTPHDPYKAGQKQWNEVYGNYIEDRNRWRMAAFGLIVIAGVAVFGMVTTKREEQIVPWVVQVDKLGAAITSGPAERALPADPKVIGAQLARFVYGARTVYTDAAAQKAIILDTYSMIIKGTPANTKLNEFMAEHSPFERAKTETVSVQPESALSVSEKVWRVDWSETRYTRDGTVIDRTHWRIDFTVSLYPPKDAQSLQANPSGIYVTDFTWTKKL